ncbi:MAG: bifunctional phosphoglucose/phosphomannose isomerase [Candidatus Zixiibacteriota bacterium]|jgi:glucose/mannose-6-phosphate isomerase
MTDGAILDQPERYLEIDVDDAGSLIRDLPELLEAGEDFGKAVAEPGRHDGLGRVAILGMGGSGVVGRVLGAYLDARVSIPLTVIREFHAPAWIDDRAVVVAISYSGNTRETLTATEEAMGRGAALVAVTSGGRLEELARESSFPCIKIPPGRPPRCSLGYMAGGLMGYFDGTGVFGFPPAVGIASHLRTCWERWGFDVPTENNDAKALAGALCRSGGAAIYGAGHTGAVAAERCRTQLAENAKYYASGHFFPELCHNELVGYEVPNELVPHLHVVVFRLLRESGVGARQVDAAIELINPVIRGVTQVRATTEDELSALFELIYFGDLVSYYLAILRGVDPKPVNSIQMLKEKLSS